MEREMGNSRIFRTLLLSAALLAPAGALIAAGTGGGGSSSPSMSAPQFDAAAEYRKGIEALQAQNFTDAKRSFGRVLQVAPRDANTNYLAGLAETGLGDLKNARKYYEKAVKADKDMVMAHRELAITYAKLGDRPKAEAELAILNQLNTDCAGTCAKAAELTASINAVQAALTSAPTARLETGAGLLFASAAAGDRAYLEAVGLI